MALIIKFVTDFLKELAYLTGEMGIYLLLGFLIAGIIHSFLPDGFVQRHVGEKGFVSSFKSALFGVPLPLCSCGVVPTALSLKKSGASNGAVVSFLISTPQTGVDSIAATYSLLGSFFAVFRVVIAFVTGVVGGFITDLFVKEDELLDRESTGSSINNTGCCSVEDNCGCEDGKSGNGFSEKLKDVFEYGFGELLESIAKWLVVGLLIGALISVVVPDEFFTIYLSNRFLTFFLVLAVSVPVYICATGSIPIASSLIMKGISPGAAFVFLMAGPATNSVTFTVLFKTIGRKATFTYIFTIVFGAIAGGLVIDFFFFDLMVKQVIANHSANSMSLIKVLGGVVFGLLLIKALLPLKKKACECEGEENGNSCSLKNDNATVYKVKGMTCNHCKMTVSKIVSETKGVKDYSINLETGELFLEGEFDFNSLKDSLEEYGYSIER